MRDIIKIGKNVCLHRNFDKLHHPDPRPSTTTSEWWIKVFKKIGRKVACMEPSDRISKKYLDVWLINFFAEPSRIFKDRNRLFMLQMAYVVSISSAWNHKLKLRVFIRMLADDDEKAILRELRKVLKEERIKAEVVAVKFDDIFRMAINAGAVIPPHPASADDEVPLEEERHLDTMLIPFEFMATSNRIIQDVSENTAVTFIYLPRPPSEPEVQVRYMELLSELTRALPPTMMIHGIHAVTSTSL